MNSRMEPQRFVLPSRPNRYLEIDLAKFVAIISMIVNHAYEVFAYREFLKSPGCENPVLYTLNFIIAFLGGVPAAPVFMFCMGLGITFSKNPNQSKLMKRGVQLLLVGLLVNFIIQILPIFWEAPSFDKILGTIPGLFANDVYFFFGLTFFFFAFVFTVKKPVLICCIVGALSLIGGFFLPYIDFDTGNTALNLVLGLFVHTDEYSYFSIASWIIFPIAGYLFGKVLSKEDSKAKFYKFSAVICAGILALTTVMGLSYGYKNSMLNPLGAAEKYYIPNFFSQLWGVAFVIIWIALCYLITGKMKDGRFKNLVIWGSKNIMPIYVLQWLTIVLMKPVLELSADIFFTCVICAVITVMTFCITKLYLYLKAKMRKTKIT